MQEIKHPKTVNQFVVGSIPTAGAKSSIQINELHEQRVAEIFVIFALEALRKQRLTEIRVALEQHSEPLHKSAATALRLGLGRFRFPPRAPRST